MASLQSNSTFSFKHHLTGEAWPACRVILPLQILKFEIVSTVGATTYTVRSVGTDRGAAPAEGQHRPKAGKKKKTRFAVPLAMFRCRFLAIVDVRTIYRYHACQECFACQSWPCLACQVVFERKGFAREMVSNCNVGATRCLGAGS